MHILKRSLGIFLLLLMAACVTVNIYFPAAAAEKAADQIIEDIWKDHSEMPEQNPSTNLGQPLGKALLYFLEHSSQKAQAQNINFTVQSPEINVIKSNMAARFPQMRPYYQSGVIGLNAQGYVSLRNDAGLALEEKAKVQQLIQAENQDRKALYAAIARANGQADWEDQIRQIFAQRWMEQAEKGWWIEAGGWKQK